MYVVIINGNEIKKSFVNKKPAIRYAQKLAKNKNRLVELWYYHENGNRNLTKWWN